MPVATNHRIPMIADKSMLPTPRRRAPRPLVAVLVAIAGLVLGSCTGLHGTGSAPTGTVWSTADDRLVDAATVVDAAGTAELLLLGETHNVARHHELQARLVEAAAAGRRPALVFEMIRQDQQAEIERWRAGGADPTAFGEAVAWEQRGWPDWSTYQPIVEAALAHQLPIYGAAPDPETLWQVGRGGLEALDATRRSELGLDRPLPEPGRERLVAVLRGAHCGAGGDAMVAAMLAVQRLRDAFLAETLRNAIDQHGAAVLIAGRGHTRSDHGVPRYLARRSDDTAVVTVGFIGSGELGDRRALDRAAYRSFAQDYVWLTSGGEPAPACAEPGDGG